jgi:CO dehydrogenase/acetyl-CoA synthase alpha subunit
MSESKGVIYILTNPSFKEYVKIGYADDVEVRLKQLNNSECIPFAFRVYATYEVDDRLTDIKLHSLIDQLNPNLRSIDNINGKKRVREFYAMSPEQAYSILETIAVISGRKERLHLYELSADERAACEKIVDALGKNFCRRCGYCAPCPKGINIPSNFLFANYLRHYGLADWAKSRYFSMDKTAKDCVGCGTCETRCPYELPIREMLKKVAMDMGEA